MPSTARLPTIEFRSLLLPPVRIPVRAIRRLCRPQHAPVVLHSTRLPQCLGQRRCLHLYKTAKAKTALGMHKVLNFGSYEIAEPTASKHKLDLVAGDKDPTIVAKDISLQELYNKHVKPGCMLYLAHAMNRKTVEKIEKLSDEAIPSEVRNYAIVKAHTRFVKVSKGQKGKQLGGLKIVIVSLASTVEYYKLALDRAYQFIANGSPVEFRIRMSGAKVTKEDKIKPGNPDAWPWLHDRFPHIRPDFILKGMPEGTFYLIKPVSDGRLVQFVMSRPAEKMPRVDLSIRLMRVKDSVQQLIGERKLSQLPKGMRRDLQAAGHKEKEKEEDIGETQDADSSKGT
ncbi:Nn.00g079180.m01.CDS01 [Neocucurbitaria sp. VM-36]